MTLKLKGGNTQALIAESIIIIIIIIIVQLTAKVIKVKQIFSKTEKG